MHLLASFVFFDTPDRVARVLGLELGSMSKSVNGPQVIILKRVVCSTGGILLELLHDGLCSVDEVNSHLV